MIVWDWLRGRRRDYQMVFGTPAGDRVLEDLATFCRANATCFHPDPRMHAIAEGRREVWLRIMQHLQFTEDQMFDFFTRPAPKLTVTEGNPNA